MSKASDRISAPCLAYVFLLIGFASLGAFVVALAHRSGLAGVAGACLAACLLAAVAGFRAGARKLAQSRDTVDEGDHVSIFSVPLTQGQVDRYLARYRVDNGNITNEGRALTVLTGRKTNSDKATVPSRLSA